MVALAGRGWQLAPSLVAMVDEANRIAPKRNRKADGSIGDAAHRNRTSDHNPSGGWVCAVDLTHAPESGFDAHGRARAAVARHDHRLKYVISNRRIARSYPKPGIPAWTWSPYTGSNGHIFHAHFSIHNTAAARNDRSLWWPNSASQPARPQEDEIVPEVEIIRAFVDWLKRPPSDEELALHTLYAGANGVPKALLNIARSDEAEAKR